ncbi:hypothetical protein JXA85_05935 [Candidatus Woesearchaeota archaeon]|nr:hypothetical protein [Candidatus Woesearchaeota archaeon]
MKIVILLILLFASGCASIAPYLNTSQDLRSGEAVVLAGLLESSHPLDNFTAVREVAFRNSAELNVLALDIIAYHRGLGSLDRAPVSSASGVLSGDYVSSAMNILSYASELVRKARPESDPRLSVMIARFEKLKLEISQKISRELSSLESVNKEISALKTVSDGDSVEKKVSDYFEKLGFSMPEDDEGKKPDDTASKLEKKISDKEKILRSIYELCGLVKLQGGQR